MLQYFVNRVRTGEAGDWLRYAFKGMAARPEIGPPDEAGTSRRVRGVLNDLCAPKVQFPEEAGEQK